jgi:hypothetical protein
LPLVNAGLLDNLVVISQLPIFRLASSFRACLRLGSSHPLRLSLAPSLLLRPRLRSPPRLPPGHVPALHQAATLSCSPAFRQAPASGTPFLPAPPSARPWPWAPYLHSATPSHGHGLAFAHTGSGLSQCLSPAAASCPAKRPPTVSGFAFAYGTSFRPPRPPAPHAALPRAWLPALPTARPRPQLPAMPTARPRPWPQTLPPPGPGLPSHSAIDKNLCHTWYAVRPISRRKPSMIETRGFL